MYRLVIFDMDGVLVDSEDTFKRSCADALHRFGVCPEYDEFTPYTGMGDTLYIGEVARAHGVEFCPEMVDEAYSLYGRYAKETLHVFPWSRPVLEGLHAAGIPMCVASSAGKFKVETNLGAIGVKVDIFKNIVTGDMVEKKKPAPDIFLKAAHLCGADPADCLVFEDALSGVAAAGADLTVCDLRDAANKIFGIKF